MNDVILLNTKEMIKEKLLKEAFSPLKQKKEFT